MTEIRFSGEAQDDGGEEGATVGGVYRIRRELFGQEYMCLLSSTQPPTPFGDVPFKALIDPAEIVDTVYRIYLDKDLSFAATASGQGNSPILQVLYYDGRNGHAITINGIDAEKDWVIYWDPWPDRSLLCAENNPANVSAQPYLDNDRLWRITRRELEAVVYGIFIELWLWELLNGTQTTRSAADIQASDFWSWFNLREIKRTRESDDRTFVHCKPGGFQEFVDIELCITESDELAISGLVLDRTFAAGSPNALFAIDLVASFLRAVLPATDKDEGMPLISLFDNLKSMGQSPIDLSTSRMPQIRSNDVTKLLNCYIGDIEKTFYIILPTSIIEAANIDEAGRKRFCLAVASCRYGSGLSPIVAIAGHTT